MNSNNNSNSNNDNNVHSYEKQIIRQHLSMTSALVSAFKSLPGVSALVSISGRLPLLNTFLKI